MLVHTVMFTITTLSFLTLKPESSFCLPHPLSC